MRRDKQLEIKDILAVHNDLKDSKYLGLPSFIGRSKKAVFNFIKERVWHKIQNWSNKLLSKAGKTIMVKNVAQSISSYSMSCFLLPKTLRGELERMLNGYCWKSDGGNNKGIRWMGWDKMAMAKNKGDLGFRNMHGFNVALLGKHIWNFCKNPSTLVARLYKVRYFPDGHILQAAKGTEASFIWTGLWEAKKQRNNFELVLGGFLEMGKTFVSLKILG